MCAMNPVQQTASTITSRDAQVQAGAGDQDRQLGIDGIIAVRGKPAAGSMSGPWISQVTPSGRCTST